MAIYPYSFTLPPVNKQDIPSNGVPGEFLGISAGGVLDWLPVSGGSGTGDLLAANNLSELTPTAGTARTNLGLGTSDSPTFANLTLTSPSLASSAPVTISQTWNAVGQTFKALVVNAAGTSGTNSAAGSLLLDLQVGGVTQASANKSGQIGAASFVFAADSGAGLFRSGNNRLDLRLGSTVLAFAGGQTNGVFVKYQIGFDSSGDTAGTFNYTQDTILLRDGAANTLALRNGAGVPQAFRVYNTFLGTTASEWFEIDWKTTAGLLKIGTTSGGTGVGRPIELNASGNYINFNIGTIVKFAVVSNRNLSYQSIEWNTDNTHDIGASGASRPRNLYVGSNIYASGNVGIGTTAPTGILDVRGANAASTAVQIGGTAANAGNIISLQGNATPGGAVQIYSNYYAAGPEGPLILGAYTNRANQLCLAVNGNVGIGTTSPTSKLHVAGSSSPTITVENTLATGASQLLFKNTVVTGDTDGIFLNGSAQSGFGGNGSLNIKATTGPIAFHTASVTNALSIAQNGVATITNISSSRVISGALQVSTILNQVDNRFFWEFSNSSDVALFAKSQTTPIMQFAGTTNLFPALKRSTTYLQARLADDSAFAPIQGKLTTDTAFTATTVTPTGFITLYDSTGAAYKVPCIPA